MKLSLKTLFSRRNRAPRMPEPLPTHDSMYIAHMRRKADDHPLHQTWARRVEW